MANLSNINGKFVVEQTTGYVGVGTTDPNYPIEVLNASAEIALNASGGSTYRIQSDSASNFIIRKEGVGDRLVINSAGTLIASQGATFGGDITIYEAAGNAGIILSGGAANNETYQIAQGVIGISNGGFSIRNMAETKDVMVFQDVTGNVGIGTSSPGRALDVGTTALIEGAGNVIAGTLALGPRASGVGKWSTISGAHYNQSSGSGNGSGAAGIMMIGTYASNNQNDIYVGGGPYEMNAATRIGFYTHTTNTSTAGGSERMRIIANGNVGIGTATPDAQLEISNNNTTSGAGGATLRLTREDGTSVAGDPVGTIEFYSTDGDGPKTTAYIKSMSEELYGRMGSLAFGTSVTVNTDAVEAMRIDYNGNVGIGTTDPGAKLHNYSTVSTDVWISGYGTLAQNNWRAGHAIFAAQGNGLLISKANAANNTNRLFLFYNNPSGYASYYMYKGDSTAVVKLDTDGDSYLNGGNVGIGVTDPDSKLEIKGAGGSTGLTFKTTDASSNETFFIQDGGRTGVRYWPFSIGIPSGTALATNAVFQVEEAGLFTVLSTGNVGIGTTNPNSYSNQNTLTINGPSTARIDFENSSNLRSSLFSTVSNTTLAVSTGFFTIDVGGSEKMRITSLGVVEIKSNSTNQASFEQTLSIAKQLGNNGVAIPVAYVDHTHSLDVTVIVRQSTSNVSSGRGYSLVAYGSGFATLTHVKGSGNVSSVAIAYLNTNPSGQNYVLTVTPTFSAGAPPIAYITIRGNSTSAISEY